MLKVSKVALVVPDAQNWLGGKNYILNLARTLCSQGASGVEVVVFCSIDDEAQVRTSLFGLNIAICSDRIFSARVYWVGLIESLLFGRQRTFTELLKKYNVDSYFESTYFAGWRPGTKVVSWIPDFQHKKFPGFFSKKSWILREGQIRLKLLCRNDFIFSSNDALKDFNEYYGFQARKKTTYVAPFAIDKESKAKVSGIGALSAYEPPREYFIVCNQMWAHKNHMLVVRAVDILKRGGISLSVLFTGSLSGGADSSTYIEIENTIKSLGLSRNIRILGIIPYGEFWD